MEYKIIEVEDMSSAAKIISAKVLVDLNREQKDEIKKVVLELVNYLRYTKSLKLKKGTIRKHGNKPFEVVYVYLYRDMDELNHGLPLARASFIDSTCKVKPMHFSEDYIDNCTTIKFDKSYQSVTAIIKDNKVSGEEFIERLEQQIEKIEEIYKSIESSLGDHDSLSTIFEEYNPILLSLTDDFIGFPDDQYSGLYDTYQSLLASLSNVGVVVNNKKYNAAQKHHLVNLHFNEAKEDLHNILQELN